MLPSRPTNTPVDVIVIGGGVAGLVAARECAHVGLRVTVVEATDALGGPVAGHELAGLHLDSGAESFAVRGGTVSAFVEGLGLTDQIVSPNPVGAWLHLPSTPYCKGPAAGPAAGSVSVPLPKAGVLGIPGSPLADDVRRVIGWRGALTAYLDRLKPVLTIGREHSLGELVLKRMGPRVLERLVEPVASGVYTASSNDLDIDVVAPGLNNALTTTGSLSGAVSMLRGGAAAGSSVGGLLGGMSTLVAALRADLELYEVEILTGTRVESLSRVQPAPQAADAASPAAWTVALAAPAASGESAGASAAVDDDPTVTDPPAPLTARFVIVATQGAQALSLIAPLDAAHAALSDLDWPAPTAVTLTSLVLDAPVLDVHPRGTGVLVAADAPGVTAKALTHVTAKWPWVAAAAGPGVHVVRLSYGRADEPNPTDDLDDTALQALALKDAATLLGVTLEAGQVRGFARTEWRDALSPATIGARERAFRVREVVNAAPDLAIAGAWLSGTGLASVIPDAMAAAARIRHAALGLV
ncbi:FAD-dependent oxidoreductase [Cryobacterium frigoriphilum]|uniref:FAD-dependent oxidoreductase n=1 Tax=Cryobacterium frigoriphilum TaxID=1259150 RepID=A0A4R9A0J2_9MICO|nr:FAD-dependent oxidoreductase [Cryobacterium frigoriphilum]TFD49864.1 FAD-dependent oxidoreductase [Cryobacterium frigoriphilum]